MSTQVSNDAKVNEGGQITIDFSVSRYLYYYFNYPFFSFYFCCFFKVVIKEGHIHQWNSLMQHKVEQWVPWRLLTSNHLQALFPGQFETLL